VYKACGAAARETVCVADLLVDFELLQYVDDVKEAMGSVKFFGSLHEDASAMSGSFTELMGELYRVRREESLRDFYRFIQAQLEKEDYAPIELCQLLFHKADTEARLHLHQDLIVTANRYFRVAVQSGNLFEFQRALNSLALAHHRLSNDEEALRLYRKLLDLYLTQGDYRSYMAVRNSMGVTMNSLDMYDEAIPLLEETRRIWLRMKAPDEANLVAINLFNAYANRGETDVALEMCKELYGEIKDDPEQERVLASLMGNMGNYAYDLKRYAEAEGYLLDTLVLNAANLGIGQVSLDVDIQDFMGVYTTNIGWNFLMSREAAKQMKEKGKGAIVFIGSNSSHRVTENRCAYCSSKNAINAMSKSFAVDWGKYGIRSNCVLPGMIKTERWINNVNNTKYCLPNYTPLHDIAEFEDVANAAWYLGSDQSRNTTGAEIIVDGGMLSQLTPNINRELWKEDQ
jgi:NAD(P)-dependent dehydrogenase (short-subunit alcohol dehydrogenase family)